MANKNFKKLPEETRNKIKEMINEGHFKSEIARKLKVSVYSVRKYAGDENG